MCLPRSHGNLSHGLDLIPSLRDLDLSSRLGWSGGMSLLALWQTSSGLEVACKQPLEPEGKLDQKKNLVQPLHSGQAGLKPKPTPSFPLPLIVSASCLPPILPKQSGRLCTWTLDEGEVLGVGSWLYWEPNLRRQCTYATLTLCQAVV